MRLSRMAFAASVWGVAMGAALATDLGDPAPPLKIAEWVKGKPVDLADGKGKTVYVVEFWATWCPPCRASIPHLTELQKKYKDKVVLIGVTDEDTAKVKPFVEKQGESMDYTVAIDDKNATAKAYMGAFGVNGIPHAFIVDKEGRIVWHGHPMSQLDQTLETVLAGKYDIETAKNRQKAITLFPQYFTKVEETKDHKQAAELGEQIMKLASKDAEIMNAFAWTILDHEDVPSRDKDLAMRAAKAALDASEGKQPAVLDTYARALFETGKLKEAVESQKKAVGLAQDEESKKDMEETLKKYEKKLADGGG